MAEIEIQIDFSDITLAETDGLFNDVEKIMLGEFPYNKNWVIRSYITITSPSGVSNMEIQCHSNKNIYIIDYRASINDVFYNYDLQALSMWAQQNGWNIPQPHFELVKENKVFWKHFWETLVVDSDYLDELYGKRDVVRQEEDLPKKKIGRPKKEE